MVTGHFSELEMPYAMSLPAGDGLSGGSQGIREDLAKQEDRIREAISTWPLAPRSGSLSGYREIYDRVCWRTVIAACCRLSSMACLPPFW
jgi:hypothetical protein